MNYTISANTDEPVIVELDNKEYGLVKGHASFNSNSTTIFHLKDLPLIDRLAIATRIIQKLITVGAIKRMNAKGIRRTAENIVDEIY